MGQIKKIRYRKQYSPRKAATVRGYGARQGRGGIFGGMPCEHGSGSVALDLMI